MKTSELERLIKDLRKAKLKTMEEVEIFLLERFLAPEKAIFLNEQG